MAKAIARAYASPGCVLLCFNWDDGALYEDFLGFSILRAPGYRTSKAQFLSNKLSFDPKGTGAKPPGTDKAPIQKFNWWDGGIETTDRGRTFMYTVTPLRGTGATDLVAVDDDAVSLSVTVPEIEDGGIASYFNRAVVSSQAFERFKAKKTTLEAQMDWLANGMENAVPDVLGGAQTFACAIYHLTDKRWILPSFEETKASGEIVYFQSAHDNASATGVVELSEAAKKRIETTPRTAAKLMHNKFIVRSDTMDRVLTGSANFTPEAITQQANVLHIIRSKELARAYADRAALLILSRNKSDSHSRRCFSRG